MNKNLLTTIAGTTLVVSIIALLFLVGVIDRPTGGVSTGEAYSATTTTSASASGTAGYVACLDQCVFGSIVVNDDSATAFRVWDATSTATSSYQGETTTGTYGKQLVQLEASLAEGTLVYDVQVKKGIVIETPTGFTGNYTVTWKK